MLPFVVGPLLLLLRPADAPDLTFNTVAGECLKFWQVSDIYVWAAAGVYAATALLLTFRLRVARVQVRLFETTGVGCHLRSIYTTCTWRGLNAAGDR